jgi:hypothetical protein
VVGGKKQDRGPAGEKTEKEKNDENARRSERAMTRALQLESPKFYF